MKDIIPDYILELENLDDSEKLDFAFHEMEMLYRSRCVNAPLMNSVKVVDTDGDKKPGQEKND